MPYIEFWLLVVLGLVAMAVICYTLGEMRGRHKERKSMFLEMSYLLHDVKSPLLAISSFMEILELAKPGSPEAQKAIRNVAWQSKLVSEEFEYLTQLALNRAMRKLTKDVTNSSMTLEEACSSTPQKEGCPLTWQLEPELYVRSNRIMLIRIMQNLIGNSQKYGEATHVTMARRGRYCRIVVVSKGSPIRWWNLRRVFGIGVQLQKDRGGRGLGLASVKMMLQCIGGRITVRNHSSGGVAFTVSLHLADKPVEEEEKTDFPHSAPAG